MFEVDYDDEEAAKADPDWFIGFLSALDKRGFIDVVFNKPVLAGTRGWSRDICSQLNSLPGAMWSVVLVDYGAGSQRA